MQEAQETVELTEKLQSLTAKIQELNRQVKALEATIISIDEGCKGSEIYVSAYDIQRQLKTWRPSILEGAHKQLEKLVANGKQVNIPIELSRPSKNDSADLDKWNASYIVTNFLSKAGSAVEAEQAQLKVRFNELLRYVKSVTNNGIVEGSFGCYCYKVDRGTVGLTYSSTSRKNFETIVLLYQYLVTMDLGGNLENYARVGAPQSWIDVLNAGSTPKEFFKKVKIGENSLRPMASGNIKFSMTSSFWQQFQYQLSH